MRSSHSLFHSLLLLFPPLPRILPHPLVILLLLVSPPSSPCVRILTSRFTARQGGRSSSFYPVSLSLPLFLSLPYPARHKVPHPLTCTAFSPSIDTCWVADSLTHWLTGGSACLRLQEAIHLPLSMNQGGIGQVNEKLHYCILLVPCTFPLYPPRVHWI